MYGIAAYSLVLELNFQSEADADTVLMAILPENKYREMKRSKTEIKLNKNILSIVILAKDVTALRASLNSCIKSITLANTLLEVS